MAETRLFVKCALPFLVMCGFTMAAASCAFSQADISAGTAHPIGERMADGTIYAGTSPDTGEAMYTTPFDAKLTYTFNQARKYAAALDSYGHHDWRVPTRNELNVLFQNRAAIGGFNISGLRPAGWYWASSPGTNLFGWAQHFSGWNLDYSTGTLVSSLRCVRERITHKT
jgi:hypothetical protein